MPAVARLICSQLTESNIAVENLCWSWLPEFPDGLAFQLWRKEKGNVAGQMGHDPAQAG